MNSALNVTTPNTQVVVPDGGHQQIPNRNAKIVVSDGGQTSVGHVPMGHVSMGVRRRLGMCLAFMTFMLREWS